MRVVQRAQVRKGRWRSVSGLVHVVHVWVVGCIVVGVRGGCVSLGGLGLVVGGEVWGSCFWGGGFLAEG